MTTTRRQKMINVICCDDETILLDELRASVAAVLPAAEIHAFNRASKVLAYIEEDNPVPDIAFLDINMRGTDGVALGKMLQQINPRINIIFCTGYGNYALEALEMNCSGYIMKPVSAEKISGAIANLRYPLEGGGPSVSASADQSGPRIKVICFGNFVCKIDDNPVHFKYTKTNELLAYLIDRNGSMCSRSELAAVLFDEENHYEYITKMRKDLIDTFTEAGLGDFIIQQKGYLAVNRSMMKCDYYDWIERKEGTEKLFRGEYMSQYSFGEFTLAELVARSEE